MRKLRLHLEQLNVESFATMPGSVPAEGTVHGNMPAGGPLVDDPISPDCAGGGDQTACGVCVGPTYSCPVTMPCLSMATQCCPVQTVEGYTCPYTSVFSCDRTECVP
jgi:hypothetical protein